MVERWCAATPDDFTFDVKLHQLFSFHSTPAKLLPPDLQSRAETDAKGNVKSTPRLAGSTAQNFSARDVDLSQRWKTGRIASATFAGVFSAETSVKRARAADRDARVGTSWRLSFEIAIGQSAINWNRQLILCGSIARFL